MKTDIKSLTFKNNFNYKILFLSALMLIIGIVAGRNLALLNQIVIIDDELGYWGIGAFLSGIDWSSAVSRGGYYSYGYSLLLTPLFWFIDNTETMYQVAVVFNILFLEITFLIIKKILELLFLHIEWYLIYGASFIAVMYTNNIVQVNVAWSECLQIFLISAIILCILKLNQKARTGIVCLFSFILIYLYMVHQRNIGIVFIGILFLFYLKLAKKLSVKQLVVSVLLIFSMFMVHFFLKRYIQGNLWAGSGQLAVNDYSGQKGNIEFLFTWEGIQCLAFGLLGRIFYLAASTGTVILWYFRKAFLNGKIIVLKKSELCKIDQGISQIVILGMFVMNLLVAAVFMIYPAIISNVLYGRYIETFLPVFLGIAILELYENYRKSIQHSLKTSGIYFVFLLLAALLLHYFINLRELKEINFIAVTGIYKYCDSLSFDLFRCVQSCLLFGILIIGFTILQKTKKISWFLLMFFMAAVFTNQADASIKGRLLEFQNLRSDNKEILKEIGLEENKQIYYYIPDEEAYGSMKDRAYLQYWLKDRSLLCVSKEELQDIQKPSYIVMSYWDMFPDSNITENYRMVYAYGDYVLWEFTENLNGKACKMSGSLFHTVMPANKGVAVIEGDMENSKIDSAFWNFKAGRYQAVFEGTMEQREEDAYLYFLVRDKDQRLYSEKYVTLKELGSENTIVSIPFELVETKELCIQVYAVNKGILYELQSVKIEQK